MILKRTDDRSIIKAMHSNSDIFRKINNEKRYKILQILEIKTMNHEYIVEYIDFGEN